MTYVAIGLCLFIVVVSAVGVVSPARLFSILRLIQTPAGLYFASAFRVVLGVLLYLLAPSSKAPDFIRIFGVLAVLAGLATPFVGLERIGTMMKWWTAKPGGVLRLWAAFALALGLSLIWALLP
jgi:hypothetical protein